MQPRFCLFGLSTRSISYSPGAGVWNCLHGSGRPPNVDSLVATFPAMVDRTISFVWFGFDLNQFCSKSIRKKIPLILRPVISYADGPNQNMTIYWCFWAFIWILDIKFVWFEKNSNQWHHIPGPSVLYFVVCLCFWPKLNDDAVGFDDTTIFLYPIWICMNLFYSFVFYLWLR